MRLSHHTLRIWWKPGAAIFVVIYFAYHIIQGNHGILAWHRLSHELEAADKMYTTIKREHDELEHRVRLLRPEGLDPDMLQERARLVLNFSAPNEVVVLK
jgi:cell division protein FtsB